MRRFKPNDYVFWLSFQKELTGIYRYINDNKYPQLLLRKDGDKRDYLAGDGVVFTLKEIETVINHPDLEQFFTLEEVLAEKEEEINKLKFKLKRKRPRKVKRK